MEPDIEARIAADYPAAHQGEVRALVRRLEDELGSAGFPRIARSALFLARGDIERLAHFVGRASQDYRDVIYWAEYDEHDSRVRDFNNPFPQL